jgi:Uri superfamily endonuclease
MTGISSVQAHDTPGLPSQAGTYVLLLEILEPLRLTVGQMATIEWPPGRYAYVGSAHGPGGLYARIRRHLKRDKRVTWHIDAVTNACSPTQVLYVLDSHRLECQWAQQLLALDGSRTPVAGFGSSDCHNGCPSHFIKLPPAFDITCISRVLSSCPIAP